MRKLRKLRKQAGLSMAECCRLTGTPYSTWKSWEDEGPHGRRTPGIAFAWLEMYVQHEKLKTIHKNIEDYIGEKSK